MRPHLLALGLLLGSASTATLDAQLVTTLPVGVRGQLVRSRVDARVIASISSPEMREPTPRWPFILGGALLGGVAATAWYAHEAAKSDDLMIDLTGAVIGIGVAGGALVGWLTGEIVRASRADHPGA
jgi:hypothetical protein